MRFVTLAVVVAVLIEGYLSASVNGPLDDSKKVVKRQAPPPPNFMLPQMGGFRPPMGAMGSPNMGPPHMGPPHMGPPNMGPPNMGPPNMGPPNMGPPHLMPPNNNASIPQPPNSGDGQSFGFGYSDSYEEGNQAYHGNRTGSYNN